jgi:hypothetical protein
VQRAIEADSPAMEVNILDLKRLVQNVRNLRLREATLLTRILSITAGLGAWTGSCADALDCVLLGSEGGKVYVQEEQGYE